ncbi:DoxX family protein [Flavobacteriaceae bacterium S0825]|uniref:DoxX family protein n=1 Tax=Gaetbulibacter sp. S0825 TaxID=2720084 RepID=UPI00142F8253|nr:DoxX family protein [Gaetbulibacter sp. S0825]MCK0110243.1 DoxX family protein [Flavobacteriaceae bacterium S0825]NIX65872.1 DoxX family protein [Gaetbulibacter sp. S0825]
MSTLENIQKKDIGLLIQRISIGILILFHGIANLTSNYSFIKNLLNGMGIPEFVAYSVFIGEIIAPILIIIGFRVRMASLVLAFNMLTAILMAHSSDIFTLNQFGGWGIELQGLYLFGAIIIFLLGAGKYAVSTTSKWD